jgi:hypothetical protein
LKEAIDLLDDYGKDKDVRLDIDRRAFLTKIAGRTNADGKFQFSRVKPGRYLLMTAYSVEVEREVNRPVGSAYSGNTVFNFWQRGTEITPSAAVLQADVTVEKDGEVVDGVVVKPVGRFIPILDIVCKLNLK